MLCPAGLYSEDKNIFLNKILLLYIRQCEERDEKKTFALTIEFNIEQIVLIIVVFLLLLDEQFPILFQRIIKI
jgi:hypothetical protein